MSRDEQIAHFIRRLKRLASVNDPSQMNRAGMAVLRRGVTNPESDHRILSVIGNWIPDTSFPWEYKCYTLVACLFAFNPDDRYDWNSTIGRSARELRNQLSVGKDSLDQQISAILDSNRDDLPVYLRHLVNRLGNATPPIRIDYQRLLRDLISLGYSVEADARIRRDWAFQYWNAPVESEPITTFQEPETTQLQEELT